MDELCMMWHSSAKGVEKSSRFVIYNNSNLYNHIVDKEVCHG